MFYETKLEHVPVIPHNEIISRLQQQRILPLLDHLSLLHYLERVFVALSRGDILVLELVRLVWKKPASKHTKIRLRGHTSLLSVAEVSPLNVLLLSREARRSIWSAIRIYHSSNSSIGKAACYGLLFTQMIMFWQPQFVARETWNKSWHKHRRYHFQNVSTWAICLHY